MLKKLNMFNLYLLLTFSFLSGLASAQNITFIAFEGAQKIGDEYTFPSSAKSWAGYQGYDSGTMQPLSFPAGGTVTFNAALLNSGDLDIRFKFEKKPHPDVDPHFYTDWITINSTTVQNYTVDIPAESSGNTYESFILFISELDRDKPVLIQSIMLNVHGSDNTDNTDNTDTSCSPSVVNGVIKIEAECYDSIIGEVQLETAQDDGGGENVGYIDPYDSLTYSVDITNSANYRLNYRLASLNGSSPGFEIFVDDNLVGNLSVSATGGWQQWQTQLGPVINLDAGQHEIKFSAITGDMNLNWFSLTQTNDSVDSPPVNNNDSTNGQPVDSSKWFHQTRLPNGYSWYNNEVQHYTDELENSFVSNGTLKIVAKKQTYYDQGHTKEYTSGRLNSKFAFKYGRVEFRAKMPTGIGTWPAVWMLGKDISEPGAWFETQGLGTTGWPECGEIDILEHWGSSQGMAKSATHTPSSSGATINTWQSYVHTISTDFHIYELDWDSQRLKFSVNGSQFGEYNPGTSDAYYWPFDREMFLLLNVAVEPSISASFTQSAMEIDYIRVYNPSGDLIFSDEFNSGDSDGDGYDDDVDAFPDDPNEQYDNDLDGIGNNADSDDDDDGVLDADDVFPFDDSESIDTDNDGVGNNTDTDDDGDNVSDNVDAFPLDSTESVDTDSDGIGNNTDNDDDGDGILDVNDVFPFDDSESIDTDNDGVGNNTDTDDDGDNVSDNVDAFPLDSTESVDTDSDGIGNNTDNDDDGDGILDVNDLNPLVADEVAKKQFVSVSNSPNAVVGGQVSLNISYDVSTGDNALSGLGLRVHYDSAMLEFIDMNNVLTTDIFIDNFISEADANDFDGDAVTDRFVSIAWASIDTGGWPKTDLPADLFTINFSVKDSVSPETTPFTTVSFSKTSSASGYEFVAPSYQLDITDLTWDFDANGHADALTDGLLLLRHTFGLSGDALINGAIALDSPLAESAVEALVNESNEIADIDNNSKVDALTDGLLLLRYLFGLRNDALTSGSVALDAQRTSNSDIEQYILDHMPVE